MMWILVAVLGVAFGVAIYKAADNGLTSYTFAITNLVALTVLWSPLFSMSQSLFSTPFVFLGAYVADRTVKQRTKS